MFQTIIPQLKEILEGIEITEGKDMNVIAHPLDKNEEPEGGYPLIIFFPDDLSNEFASNKRNFKIMKFRGSLTIPANNISNEDVFLHLMPKNADKLIKKLDEEWDGVVVEDLGRVWIKTSYAYWDVEQTEKGKLAFMNFDIIVKFQHKI